MKKTNSKIIKRNICKESPPYIWRRLLIKSIFNACARITPTHMGKTRRLKAQYKHWWNNPHAYGKTFLPIARIATVRITPVYMGKTN